MELLELLSVAIAGDLALFTDPPVVADEGLTKTNRRIKLAREPTYLLHGLPDSTTVYSRIDTVNRKENG